MPHVFLFTGIAHHTRGLDATFTRRRTNQQCGIFSRPVVVCRRWAHARALYCFFTATVDQLFATVGNVARAGSAAFWVSRRRRRRSCCRGGFLSLSGTPAGLAAEHGPVVVSFLCPNDQYQPTDGGTETDPGCFQLSPATTLDSLIMRTTF